MNNCLLISDAAKEVKVESHVLRYWEEELHLPIKRNELGHRYYTEADVQRFKQIKSMKERGLQLKAIKMILKDGRLDVLPDGTSEENVKEGSVRVESMKGTSIGNTRVESVEGSETEGLSAEGADTAGPELEGGTDRPVMAIDIVDSRQGGKGARGAQASQKPQMAPALSAEVGALQETGEDRSRKLQWVLQEMIRRAVQENNAELCRELKESVIKELDYQFRMQEERDEIRDKRLAERDEEYYKRMDELLRRKSRYSKAPKREKNGGGVGGVAILGIENAGTEAVEPIPVGERQREKAIKTDKKKRHFF